MFERLTSPGQLERLTGMFHEVLNETGRGRLFEQIGRFAEEQFPSVNQLVTNKQDASVGRAAYT